MTTNEGKYTKYTNITILYKKLLQIVFTVLPSMELFQRMKCGWNLGVTREEAHSSWAFSISSPNAPQNTCVFSIFEAPDTYTNIEIGYIDTISELQSHTWRYTYTQILAYINIHVQLYKVYIWEEDSDVSMRWLWVPLQNLWPILSKWYTLEMRM